MDGTFQGTVARWFLCACAEYGGGAIEMVNESHAALPTALEVPAALGGL